MHQIRTDGEIKIQCKGKLGRKNTCGYGNVASMNSLVFVPEQIPDGVADDFEPTQVATHQGKCPSCENEIGFTITVTPTKAGKIEDFDVSYDGCETVESEDKIRGMIIIE